MLSRLPCRTELVALSTVMFVFTISSSTFWRFFRHLSQRHHTESLHLITTVCENEIGVAYTKRSLVSLRGFFNSRFSSDAAGFRVSTKYLKMHASQQTYFSESPATYAQRKLGVHVAKLGLEIIQVYSNNILGRIASVRST